MKWSFEGKWIASVFGLALLLMGTISIVSYRNASQLIESTKQVTRTQALLEHLTDIAGTLADAESGRRGYILFNDESELQRYYAAIQSLAHQIKQLQHRIADPDQQQRLLRLDSLIKQHIALLKQSVDLYQSNSIVSSTQAVLSTQSKRKWDEIQQALAQMESREEQLLERWVKQYQISIRYSMLLEVLGTCLSFVILCGVYALLYRQIRKRQKAENLQQTLKQEKTLNELKLRFFSMVSHEFRTPLSIILGSAQLLIESSQPLMELKKQNNLHRIQSSAKLMSQLLTDILTLTRAEAGKLECYPELIDLESFCLNLVEDILLSNAVHNPIKFVSIGQCSHAMIDEKLLYSILSNLLSNARKYSPQGKQVEFSLNCSAEVTIFQIKDEGIGISSIKQQHLYEPFHRGENVGGIVGTGLGLAVVKRCVEIHQGQIICESEVGRGTTFTVKIPQQMR